MGCQWEVQTLADIIMTALKDAIIKPLIDLVF